SLETPDGLPEDVPALLVARELCVVPEDDRGGRPAVQGAVGGERGILLDDQPGIIGVARHTAVLGRYEQALEDAGEGFAEALGPGQPHQVLEAFDVARLRQAAVE